MIEIKVIRADLPSDLDSLELHIFADEHTGDQLCDIKRLKQRIEHVRSTPNAYCVLNGDLMDNATKTSIGDTYSQALNPMQQLGKVLELFEPIKDKIIAITPGNHENRTYKTEGIDLTSLLAMQLGLSDKYSPTAAFIFLRFGHSGRGKKETNGSGLLRKMCYTIYALHGTGGGRSEGSKATRLAAMAGIVDADVYIHSHTHMPMILSQSFFRTDRSNSVVYPVDKLFVNNGANLDYGGYGEAAEYKPSSKRSPVIYFNGTEREYTARM